MPDVLNMHLVIGLSGSSEMPRDQHACVACVLSKVDFEDFEDQGTPCNQLTSSFF